MFFFSILFITHNKKSDGKLPIYKHSFYNAAETALYCIFIFCLPVINKHVVLMGFRVSKDNPEF